MIKNDSTGPVVLDVAGYELNNEDKEVLAHPKTGGLILFSRNYDNLSQLSDLVRQIREVKKDMLVCVDQEGGRVQRFREGFSRLPAMQSLGRRYSRDSVSARFEAKSLGWLMAAELINIDIDLSFAPVLDIDDNQSDIIGDRAFSSKADEVVDIAGAFIEGMHEAGMKATGKHFPGHGSVRADSHLELPVNPLSLGELERGDLIPFRALLSELDALMSAHILYPSIDSDLVSYSSFWLKDFLREELGFTGCIFSDDLSMVAATEIKCPGERAVLALEAGCDSVIICNEREAAVKVLETLEDKFTQAKQSKLCNLRHNGKIGQNLLDLPQWQHAQQVLNKLV